MLQMSMGFSEHVFRVVAVYVFLFIALRYAGKKHIGELAPFDLVVLLILSETVQNAMIGDDTSLLGGLVSAGTLLIIAYAMNWLSWRSKAAARLLEGVPRIVVRHGRRCKEVLENEQISMSELMEALRRNGCSSITNVRVAVLENDGKISVVTRERT